MKKKKKQIKKNSKLKKKANFKKNKQQSSPRGGSNPALYNEPRKHRLSGNQIYNI